ncbi:MAG: hypothetical protein B7Z42_09960 [Brevundimonas sp. 12-68-7]|jgi:hypothetical protein|uniref:Toxin-antitoxin system HicB family antitoxin n=2 Tax=Brevundimonas TaxID=41275 RepID=A0A258FK66_9CAUL|nr:MAG: hypothetical protein B7Z42_09960 [Brevundimonas sp. 12-68-7]OYX32970.1 MAG: hypothetical protein B7Z01_10055 [Brevundimonas subvibrioides]
MARARKPFLMRASPGLMAAVERLAAAELRSVNAQMEMLVREALARRGVAVPAEDDRRDDSA